MVPQVINEITVDRVCYWATSRVWTTHNLYIASLPKCDHLPVWRNRHHSGGGAGRCLTGTEQVFPGRPASALLWGNTIFSNVNFQKYSPWCKSSGAVFSIHTAEYPGNRPNKCDWSAPQPVKQHVWHWDIMMPTHPRAYTRSACNVSEGLKCPLSPDRL